MALTKIQTEFATKLTMKHAGYVLVYAQRVLEDLDKEKDKTTRLKMLASAFLATTCAILEMEKIALRED